MWGYSRVEMELSVMACNYLEPVSASVAGARAYVIGLNFGNGCERVHILARSRSGRWIERWESLRRVGNFRLHSACVNNRQHALLLDRGAMFEPRQLELIRQIRAELKPAGAAAKEA
jgi:hypothetical protein